MREEATGSYETGSFRQQKLSWKIFVDDPFENQKNDEMKYKCQRRTNELMAVLMLHVSVESDTESIYPFDLLQ